MIIDINIGPILLLIDKEAINRIIKIIQDNNNKIPSYSNINLIVAINVGKDTEKDTDKTQIMKQGVLLFIFFKRF